MFAYKVIEKEKRNYYERLNMDFIRPNPYQPRTIFDNAEIEKLAESIKEYGLIQPITVRKMADNNYELIAGERRFRACRLCGFTQIDAFVLQGNENQSAMMALIENVQRQDLHFFEEATAIGQLIKEHNLTQEQLSKSLGKKQSTIANKLRILRLSFDVRQLIIKYGLTERHARALLKITDENMQLMVVENIYDKGLNVKKTEDYIESLLSGQTTKKRNKFSKFVCDNRIYINSVKSIYKSMIERGVKAEFDCVENIDNLVINIKICK